MLRPVLSVRQCHPACFLRARTVQASVLAQASLGRHTHTQTYTRRHAQTHARGHTHTHTDRQAHAHTHEIKQPHVCGHRHALIDSCVHLHKALQPLPRGSCRRRLAAAEQANAREHLVTLEGLNEAVEGAGPVAVDARGPWPGEHPGLWPWMHGARGQPLYRSPLKSAKLGKQRVMANIALDLSACNTNCPSVV